MATINNKLIHFKSKSDFNGRYAESTDGGNTYGDFLGTSIVFIQDAKQIWTHGQFYDANETTLASLGITATAAELNKLDGVTATTQELNYVDGVTSNIQTQLNNKAASSHNHSAANITSGVLDIERLPSITDAKITSISADKITGTIPQENLPSYVDDVLEYSTKSGFPQTGETGKIYVDLTTNLTYRWGGSNYVEISPSIALGETSSTAYRGDRGKIAYDHSQETGNPHDLTLSDLGISATVTELNYMDGVTSNVQDQLDSKVSQDWVEEQGYLTSVSWAEVSGKPSTFTPAAHTHSASDITSGTLSISRIPTGTSAATVALGNHTHSGYATSSHIHGTDDIVTLTGYTEGTSTTTLSSSMDLNEALASLQNQIQTKQDSGDYAQEEHFHSADDITSGILPVDRGGTGIRYNPSMRVDLGSSADDDVFKMFPKPGVTGILDIVHGGTGANSVTGARAALGLATVASTGNYEDLTNKPDISDLATKTELAGYLPLTGGTLSGALTLENNATLSVSGNSSLHYVEVFGGLVMDQGDLIINTGKIFSQGDGSQLILSAGETGYGTVQLQGGQNIVSLDQGGFKYNSSKILTEEDVVSDAHLKAGTSNNIAIKLFLVGGKEQNNNGELTYSQTAVYMQNNQLYASRMNATNGFYETSDGTLKNIKSELNIADNIDKIPTVLFSWKKDEPEDINQDVPVHIGTIAQDIQKIYPDLVAKNAEGHLTVDYARLSVVAIAAIKELKKEIEMLKSKIN